MLRWDPVGCAQASPQRLRVEGRPGRRGRHRGAKGRSRVEGRAIVAGHLDAGERRGKGMNIIERLQALCERAGGNVEELDQPLIDRISLLAERTSTLDDCERAMDIAAHIFEHYARQGDPFSEVEKATVRFGSLFSDIGKTGPGNANLEQQRLIAEMFSIEGVSDDKMSVAHFFERYFPRQATERTRQFASLGLDPKMTMREFWNLHSGWTLQVMQRVGVPHEAVAAAATHHLLENINPDSIVADDGTFTRQFGTNSAFDRAEKLVIVLDKYDAARRRGSLDHAAAIAWLRQLIAKNARFSGDPQFAALITALDEVMSVHGSSFYEQRLTTLPR